MSQGIASSVALVEIRLSYTKSLAITSSADPLYPYYHFADDGLVHFRNKDNDSPHRAYIFIQRVSPAEIP